MESKNITRRTFICGSTCAIIAGCAPAVIPSQLLFNSVIYLSERNVLFPLFEEGGIASQIAIGAGGSAFWDLLQAIPNFIKWLFRTTEEQQKINERQALIDAAKKSDMDIGLIIEAANIYGDKKIIDYINMGIKFWYKYNNTTNPINSFTFSVKNTSYRRTSGQVIFNICDSITGKIENKYYTDVFGLEPNEEFTQTKLVTQYPLPNSGLKLVNIIQVPENCEVNTSNIMILQMSPSTKKGQTP